MSGLKAKYICASIYWYISGATERNKRFTFTTTLTTAANYARVTHTATSEFCALMVALALGSSRLTNKQTEPAGGKSGCEGGADVVEGGPARPVGCEMGAN